MVQNTISGIQPKIARQVKKQKIQCIMRRLIKTDPEIIEIVDGI